MSGHRVNLVNILTPVLPGHTDALRGRLAEIASVDIFGRLESVHFARWVIIADAVPKRADLPRPTEGLRLDYLLFSAGFNGRPEDVLDRLRLQAGPFVDTVWGHCVNYPGSSRRRAYHRYLRHNSLPVQQRFLGYDATVAEVRRALDLRDKHIKLACETQGRSNEEVLDAFTKAFGATSADY
jgi:hypothetical protein